MICHYWYFKDISKIFERYLNQMLINISMMGYAILNVKVIDYRCILWNRTRNDAINRINSSRLDDKGTL